MLRHPGSLHVSHRYVEFARSIRLPGSQPGIISYERPDQLSRMTIFGYARRADGLVRSEDPCGNATAGIDLSPNHFYA